MSEGKLTKRIHPAAPRPIGDPAEAPLVLVAEDEEASRSALLEILLDAGYRAVGVQDGLGVLDLAPALRPAAVILDLAMPGVNGIETAAALRSDPELGDVRILAVSASWLAERGDLLAAAGFDGALRKPCTGEALLGELGRLLPRPEVKREIAV